MPSRVPCVHLVPMCRQLIGDEEWEEHGGDQLDALLDVPGGRLAWSDRACGMASLRMVLLAYGLPAPTVTELVIAGVKRDAFIPGKGWLHSGIADLAADHGLAASAQPVDADDVPGLLAGAPVIVSVTERLPVDGRRGGHLIVARGVSGDDILFRDPSSWGQTTSRVPAGRFFASYSGRAITFPPITAPVTAPAAGRTS